MVELHLHSLSACAISFPPCHLITYNHKKTNSSGQWSVRFTAALDRSITVVVNLDYLLLSLRLESLPHHAVWRGYLTVRELEALFNCTARKDAAIQPPVMSISWEAVFTQFSGKRLEAEAGGPPPVPVDADACLRCAVDPRVLRCFSDGARAPPIRLVELGRMCRRSALAFLFSLPCFSALSLSVWVGFHALYLSPCHFGLNYVKNLA